MPFNVERSIKAAISEVYYYLLHYCNLGESSKNRQKRKALITATA